MNVFNEKAITVLEFNDKKCTAVFDDVVTQMWILNFKTKDCWVLLNDKYGSIIQWYHRLRMT